MDIKKYITILFVALLVFGCSCSRSAYDTALTIVPERSSTGDKTTGENTGVSNEPEESAGNSDEISTDGEKKQSSGDTENVLAYQSTPDMEEKFLTVYVCGEVVNAGVYTLKEGSRICDAVALAGGFTDAACETSINLADYIFDGEMIEILSEEEASSLGKTHSGSDPGGGTAVGGGGKAGGDGLVNINTADEALLKTLPGIGDSKAKAIMEYRQEHGQFTSIEDIMKIGGIKEGIFNNIKDYITV